MEIVKHIFQFTAMVTLLIITVALFFLAFSTLFTNAEETRKIFKVWFRTISPVIAINFVSFGCYAIMVYFG